MNGEITDMNTSKQSSEIISIIIAPEYGHLSLEKHLGGFFFLIDVFFPDKFCLQRTVDASYLHFLCWVLEVSLQHIRIFH